MLKAWKTLRGHRPIWRFVHLMEDVPRDHKSPTVPTPTDPESVAAPAAPVVDKTSWPRINGIPTDPHDL